MNNCQRGICNKKKSCQILGQCAMRHEFISEHEDAKVKMAQASTLNGCMAILERYATRRIILPTGRRHGKRMKFIQAKNAWGVKLSAPKMSDVRWSNEQINEKINSVEEDIRTFDREVSSIDSQITALQEKKKSILLKISRKHIYKNQLFDSLVKNDSV